MKQDGGYDFPHGLDASLPHHSAHLLSLLNSSIKLPRASFLLENMFSFSKLKLQNENFY